MKNFTIGVAMWLCCLLIGVVPGAWAGDSDAERLLEAEFVGWSNHMDQLLAVFTEDVVYEDVAMGVVNHGKEQFKGFANLFFTAFPDIKFSVDSIHVSGDWVTVEWTVNCTQDGDLPGLPATHKRVSLRGMSLAQLDGGKIKRQLDYWNEATMLRQIGVLPAPK